MQPALEEDDEVYVPTRSFLNIFGAQLACNEEASAITILADDHQYLVNMDLTNLSITLSDNSTLPIKMVDCQTYIPLGLVKEILNFNFSWDDENKTLHAIRIPETVTVFKNLAEAPEYEVVKTLTGIASWYGGKFHGRNTTSGEKFDENGLTAAHRTLPFNTYLRVTFVETNKCTIVRINDRGPHVASRLLDLSKGAAEEIGLKPHGLGKVKVEVLANYTDI